MQVVTMTKEGHDAVAYMFDDGDKFSFSPSREKAVVLDDAEAAEWVRVLTDNASSGIKYEAVSA